MSGLSKGPRILVVDQSAGISLGASFHRGLIERGRDAHLFVGGRWTGWEHDARWVRAARRLVRPAAETLLNLDLVRTTRRLSPDLVLVIKGPALHPMTVDAMRAPGRLLVAYHPDDLRNPLNTTPRMRACLTRWDALFTPRHFALAELCDMGVRHVEHLPFGYDPHLSHPPQRPLGADDPLRTRLSFVGAWAPERQELLEALVARGVPVKVFGARWEAVARTSTLRPQIENRPLTGEVLRQAFHGSAANLSLLRKANRDLHQMRTFEVPACGGLLLAERTEDHLRWFDEGREALFFETADECAEAGLKLLREPAWARAIAEAGRGRTLADGHSYAHRAEELLARLGLS